MINYPATYTTSTGPVQAPVVTRVVSVDQSDSYLDEIKQMLAIDLGILDYDMWLLRLLKTAIDNVEQYTRLSLQPTTVLVQYAQYEGRPLPFGPVWAEPIPVVTKSTYGSTITMSDSTGAGLMGSEWPVLINNFSSGSVSYTAGYSKVDEDPFAIPEALAGAILDHAASSFRAGGIQGGNPGTYWKTLAGRYRRFD